MSDHFAPAAYRAASFAIALAVVALAFLPLLGVGARYCGAEGRFRDFGRHHRQRR